MKSYIDRLVTTKLASTLLLLSVAVSCKTTPDAQVKDLAVAGGRDKIGFAYLRLQPDLPAEVKAQIKIDNMRIYAFDPPGNSADADYRRLSDVLFMELSKGQYVDKAPAKYLDQTATALSVSAENFVLSLPGGNQASLKVSEQGGGRAVSVSDLELQSWQRCPFALTNTENAFAEHMRSRRPDLPLVIREPKYSSKPVQRGSIADIYGSILGPLRADNLRFTAKSISYNVTCRLPARFDGIKQDFYLNVDARITAQFARDVFVVPLPDRKFVRLDAAKNLTEKNQRGTRFFHSDTASGQPKTILRWNPMRRPLVIDDVYDGRGVELNSTAIGQEVQKAYKAAVADLRVKFPELGKRLVLRSEAKSPTLPQITASIGDEIVGAIGMAGLFYEDANGEIVMARVALGQDDRFATQKRMLVGLSEIGLVESVDTDLRATIQYTVLHELGHALGLRHNFAGIATTSDGKTAFNAIMSYAGHGVPLSLLGFKAQFLDHDVLSLRYLYADLFADPRRVRAQTLAKLLTLPLSEDELTQTSAEDYLTPAKDFYAYTQHPKVQAARAKLGDREFFAKIAAVLKLTYGETVEFPALKR